MSVHVMTEQEVAEYNKTVQEWWSSLEYYKQWEIYQFLVKFDSEQQKIAQTKVTKKFEERLTTCPNCEVTYDRGFSSKCPHRLTDIKSI